ncbi:MAG: nucleoside hydrolase-like domain-containing protein [Candidatus Brocadiia bacterium]
MSPLHPLAWSLAVLVLAAAGAARSAQAAARPRIIATTDGEIDDRCSMVRFLLYANEWDIEAIIYSSSKFHWQGHKWAGTQWVQDQIACYAQVYESLRRHDPAYPSPQELASKVYVGNVAAKGEMDRDTPGSRRIVEVLLDARPGPVYLQAWGGTNTIARALWSIEHEHPEAKERVSAKAIIYIILDQDETFRRYIQPRWPNVQVLGSFRQFAAIAYRWHKLIPPEQRRFFAKDWMAEHILERHGPLCAAYPTDHFKSEGDSPSFMHQVRTGLGSLAHPSYGGWGGRFEPEPGSPSVWRGAKDDGDLYKPIWRWAEDFQNDWAARADWCVKSPEQANHPPVPRLNGVAGDDVVALEAHPGETVGLSADGSTDPDGDALDYHWWLYPEPGTCPRATDIRGATETKAEVAVPPDAQDAELHVVLTVRDHGSPRLAAYRRAIIRVPPAEGPLVRVGFADDETPLRLHGPLRRRDDGAIVCPEGEPWGWAAVGEGDRPLRALERLRSFTILGWARPESLDTGSGGNRIACNLNYDTNGFDLVHLADGRLRLAVNQWPDRCRDDSSPARLEVGHWTFFAVTYDAQAPKHNVRWYFGDHDTPAAPDRANAYRRGPTGAESGPLAVANYNPTLHRHGLDRQFRGTLARIRIFGRRTGGEGALGLEAIRKLQAQHPPRRTARRPTP